MPNVVDVFDALPNTNLFMNVAEGKMQIERLEVYSVGGRLVVFG